MLVDINLLPRKEKKSQQFTIVLTVMLVLLLSTASIFAWQVQAMKAEKQWLATELSQTTALREALEGNLTNSESANAILQLEEAVTWAERSQLPTVFFLQHITGLLPERGFILTFEYEAPGTVALAVQFDSNREAAYFLNRLKTSSYVEVAELLTLSAVELTNENSSEEELPRYIGEYELLLNVAKLQIAAKEGEDRE